MQQSEAEVDDEGPNTSGCSSGYPHILFKVHSNHCLSKTIQCGKKKKKKETVILNDCLELEVYSTTWKVNGLNNIGNCMAMSRLSYLMFQV